MADGFEEEAEPYHVPQQSRREKLRVVLHNHPAPGCAVNPHDCAGLLPLPSDLLTCAALQHQHHLCDQHQQLCMDPPSSLQDFSGNPFFFAPQNLKLLDQSYTTNNNGTAGHEIMVYKPEPLALSLSSHNPVQHFAAGSSSAGLSRSSVPLGPFTGYASILKGSRFLRPAQQLLEELCDVACRGIYAEKISAVVEVEDSVLMDCPPAVDLGGSEVDDVCGVGDGGERRRKKSRLISMLDEVYKRYKYYYQQMQAVVASFESVAGLSNAAPFANLALKAMSKHFRSLKNAIIDQLHFANKAQNCHKDESTIFGNSDGIIHFTQRPAQNTGLHDHQPVWRPQRGLPERAVTVLRAWLFDHFLHPYPTDTDKMMLAKQTGLSRNQVSNWFINARVRLWKPMVEEIHNLETRQVQKTPPRNEQNADKPSDSLPTTTSIRSQNPSTLASKTLDFPSKRAKNELPVMANGTEEPMRSYYENLSRNQFLGVGSSTPRGSGSVSLTLGLHQNNGIGIHEPFPINAARRFGLDANTQGYVLNNFESQNREFGRDVIGGQLLHDFVG